MSNTSSAQRIAKNTFFLYFRTFIMMTISIYTSRVVLKVLGVEDFGIYNLVGGVVAIFASLKSVFSSAIQRYINFTRGKGDEEGVRHIFSLSFIIQIILAVIFFIVVESFGLWFIPNKLVIPDGMMSSAMFVFHCSIMASIIGIVGIPFDALIIANEKMNFYAYVSILDSVLRLLIVFLLPFLSLTYLCSYAILIMVVQALIVFINFLYCRRFPECKIEKFWDKNLFKQLASFSGWSFFGNIVFSLVHEGTNFILNIFAGVVANAARGIATQVKSAIGTLSGNLYLAAKPFVMQKAASVEKATLFGYIYILSRVIFYVILITIGPIIVFCNQILSIWLVEIPDYTVTFVRVIMLYELVRALHSPIVMLFFSVGNIKRFQITESLVGIITLPLVYILLSRGLPLYMAFVAMIIVEVINIIAIILVAQKEIKFSLALYVRNVVIKCILAALIVFVIGWGFFSLTHSIDKYYAIPLFILMALCSAATIFLVVMGKEEKSLVKGFFIRKRQ